MYWMGLGIFAVYGLILFIDEFAFHRRKGLAERRSQALDTFWMAACAGVVSFVEYGDMPRLVFGGLSLISMIWMTRNQFEHARHATPGEHYLHSLQFVLHPILLITLMAVWQFIDGAGLVVGMVLPFSTGGLRPLVYEFFGVVCALAAYQLYRHAGARKPKTDVVQGPMPAAQPAAAPSTKVA
jgi:hypothetical protein